MNTKLLTGSLAGMALSLATVLPAQAASAPDLTNGAQIFNNTCAACHGANGKGLIPGSTPNFTKVGGVLSQKTALLESRVKNGFQGPNSAMAMPPKGGNSSLTDKDIHDVVGYLRSEFLHK